MRVQILIAFFLLSCNSEPDLSSKLTIVQKTDSLKTIPIKKEKAKSLYDAPSGIYKNKSTSFLSAKIVTNLGSMSFELFPNESPIATESFVNLAKVGFYNGNEFFRIHKGFVVQTGDKTNTGYADAGYHFKTEVHPDLSHDRIGLLSFANTSTESNSSQFFITLSAQKHLDGKHPIFGLIMSGREVLEKIAAISVDEKKKPLKPVFIKSVEIIE